MATTVISLAGDQLHERGRVFVSSCDNGGFVVTSSCRLQDGERVQHLADQAALEEWVTARVLEQVRTELALGKPVAPTEEESATDAGATEEGYLYKVLFNGYPDSLVRFPVGDLVAVGGLIALQGGVVVGNMLLPTHAIRIVQRCESQ